MTRFFLLAGRRLTWIVALSAAVLASCGGGSSGPDEAAVAAVSTTTPIAPRAPVPPETVSVLPNVLPVVVDRGPAGTSFNMPFVSVTVCIPGTATCRTVDHVLVDTGSTGLRLIASALGSGMELPAIATPAGLRLAQCAQFSSGFSWGSVRRADIRLAGETAARMPVQLIGDPSAPFATIPSACSNTGADLGSVAALGANGILGVDMSIQDCGATCVTSTAPRLYYGCTSTSCATTVLPLESQVTNPVAAFAVNNNGLALTLPPIQQGGAATVVGTLTFGIGTQANNQLDRATVYTTNARGQFTTVYKGTTYPSSFIDSGSNALFFDDPSIPTCSSFYCPPVPLSFTALNVSPSGATVSVSFTVDDARSLTAGVSAFNLGGTLGLTRTFDFGLPFFFGRTVFVALQGAQTAKGLGPFLAY